MELISTKRKSLFYVDGVLNFNNMSKLSKRKTIVLVGNRIDTTYERQKNNRDQAIEIAKNTPDKIKQPTKYDLKR